MASTPAQRLEETQRAYRDAYKNRIKDYRDAQTNAEVNAIQRNLNNAERAYIDAGVAVLAQTGAAVESAFRAAKAANDAVEKGRKDAVALADRIELVAGAVKAVTKLVSTAKK
ncbi:MAG: hypothetical protein K2X34_12430 [Hyphomonadaceae bacterium]|nr:hypothetical protein [Hyphomonadaceae bacterium]